MQHTSLSCHFSPQMPTSLVRNAASGVSALALSGHGRSEPKKPCLPQCPRMAHRPASCMSVQPSAARATEPIVVLAAKSDTVLIFIVLRLSFGHLKAWQVSVKLLLLLLLPIASALLIRL